MKLTPKEIVKRTDRLRADKATFDSHFQECRDYVMPSSAPINSARTPGQKESVTLYDSTAIRSNINLSAGLHGQLTPPSAEWFRLASEREKDNEGRDWLDDTQNRIFSALNKSNFSAEIHESYLDLGCYGTSCLAVEDDPRYSTVVFDNLHIGTYCITENERGFVDSIWRFYTETTRNIFDRWGKRSGEKVLKDVEKGKLDTPHVIYHAVGPREEYDRNKKTRADMPFFSMYVMPDKFHELETGGHHEFPFNVARWTKSSDEVFGRSPAMTALADIKMLNEIAKTLLQGGQKQNFPPLVLSHEGFLLPISTEPDAILYAMKDGADAKYLQHTGNMPLGLEFEDRRRDMIKETFFYDLFMMLQSLPPKMTATEVMERVAEKMLILGPILGRLQAEMLDPLIVRVFNIMSRRGQLAPPPPSMRGQQFEIQYISNMARMQRFGEVKAIQESLGFAGQIAQFKPEVLDNYNADRTIRVINDVIGVPEEIMNDEDERDEIRKIRAEQEQAQGVLAEAQQLAEIEKTAPAQIEGEVEEVEGVPV